MKHHLLVLAGLRFVLWCEIATQTHVDADTRACVAAANELLRLGMPQCDLIVYLREQMS